MLRKPGYAYISLACFALAGIGGGLKPTAPQPAGRMAESAAPRPAGAFRYAHGEARPDSSVRRHSAALAAYRHYRD